MDISWSNSISEDLKRTGSSGFGFIKKILRKHFCPQYHIIKMSSIRDSLCEEVLLRSSVLDNSHDVDYEVKLRTNSAASNRSVRKSLISQHRKSNVPLMGKKALLARSTKDLDDSDIIHDLVVEKYTGILNNNLQRSLNRRSSRGFIRTSSNLDVYNSYYNPSSHNSSSSNKKSLSVSSTSFCEASIDLDLKYSFETLDVSGIDSIKSGSSLGYNTSSFLKNEIEQPNIGEGKESIGTDEVSTLLSRASSIYSSVKKGLKKIHSQSKNSDSELLDVTGFSDHHLEDLIRDIAVQNEVMLQTSKALEFCRTKKEFWASPEHLEAERILLIAMCKKDSLTTEANRLQIENCNYNEDYNIGSLTISNMKFSLKDKDESKPNDCYSEYYVCIISCGKTVISTDVTSTDQKSKVLYFQKEFHFKNLSTLFEICISIYGMKLKKSGTDTKSSRNKVERRSFHIHKKFFTLNKNHKYKVSDEIRSSSFVLLGKFEVRIPDLKRQNTFRMYNVPKSSSLTGYFSAELESQVKLVNKKTGFMNVASSKSSSNDWSWNRRWCRLEGHLLKYWNYPSEDNDAEPINVIDLKLSYCRAVEPANRAVCAKQKTLYLPVLNRDNEIVNYYLSTDTWDEMRDWQNQFNYVLYNLYHWNCL